MVRLVCVALILVVGGLLTGCDKCGKWVEPRLPSIPASCADR